MLGVNWYPLASLYVLFSSKPKSEQLQEYPGALNFVTDAWSSPNHRAFVVWTVHIKHDGHPLSFLLDIMEVAEVSSCFLLTRRH